MIMPQFGRNSVDSVYIITRQRKRQEPKRGILVIMEEKQSILAAGAGASTKFVFEHGERIERVENVKDLKNYVERIDEMIERKRIGMEKYLPK